jgi:hypothetical protein
VEAAGIRRSATRLVQFGPGGSQENVKKMSRKHGETIEGIETTYEIRFWSIKERAFLPALIEAAQGTNSQDIGCCLPIVLGLGSKRAYFTTTRARTRSKAELAVLILLCGGLTLRVCQSDNSVFRRFAANGVRLLRIVQRRLSKSRSLFRRLRSVNCSNRGSKTLATGPALRSASWRWLAVTNQKRVLEISAELPLPAPARFRGACQEFLDARTDPSWSDPLLDC